MKCIIIDLKIGVPDDTDVNKVNDLIKDLIESNDDMYDVVDKFQVSSKIVVTVDTKVDDKLNDDEWSKQTYNDIITE